MSVNFEIHDVSEYPFVRFLGDKIKEGFGERWCQEMDALTANSKPFVMLFIGEQPEEAHADRKIRGAWLKENKTRLADKCLAFLIIEPDADKREKLAAMFPNLKRAFGIAQAACATEAEALELALKTLTAGSFIEKL